MPVASTKVDYKRELGALYAAKRQPVVVDVSELACLMIDGHGDPNTSPEYRVAIVQPPVVTAEIVEQARAKVAARKPLDAIALVRLDRFAEGKAAQLLHVGPYSAEGPTIECLHQLIAAHAYRRIGKHLEIHLSDPRRSAPEKLRTIVRQPIE